MNNNAIDAIIEDLFQIFPLVMKKFQRSEPDRASKGVSRQDLAIMGMISQSGTLPISEIGKRLLISKPQMTYIIDRLINLGIVDRMPDKTDRRITNIKLTRKGKSRLERNKNLIRDTIREKLASLSRAELKMFSDSLTAIKEISEKLE
jgi:DNA-binding MarR family transcriptional regulator